MQEHSFHPSIFREYDIRGIYNETLFPADAYHIGLAYAALVKKGRICVGYDGRLSSPRLSGELIRGLVDGGIEVVNIGLGPTPLLYFSVFHLDTDGGIMVTGSHNPGNHNGFKIMLGKESLFGDDIRAIAGIKGQVVKNKGTIERIDLKEEYITKITEGYEPSLWRDIGFDPGNGAAGQIVTRLAMLFDSALINEEIDGNFPAHHPDPTVEANLEQLKALVLENDLDVGFAFDGDGDRVGVIDNLGRPIWGDQILAILAQDVLKRHPGAPIIADVKTSSAVFDHIAKLGGKPVMWKTGHSLVKAKMKELNSPLAGEMSAHIFIKDGYYGYDDGIYAALRFLYVMQQNDKTAAELLDELPKMVTTPEIKIPVSEETKFALIDAVKKELVKDGADFSDIDGVRVNNKNGWWLLRASNTGAYLVARCEGTSQEGVDRLNEELKNYAAKAGITYQTDQKHH